MSNLKNSLPFKNLIKRPARSTALLVLAAFLAFSVCAGTLVISSLRSGLGSLQDRLGADIMVVPYEAATKSDLEDIVLQGNTGYFYMDSKYYDQVAAIDGVGQISAQYFLASTSSGCCSIPVQIIGYDPETDFTISPWIKKSGGNELQDMDVVVGNDLNAFVGDTLTFYNTEVHVAAKLEKTGTALDTAVYTNVNTIKALIQSSLDMNMNSFSNLDPDHVVSCVLVNVADGYNVDEVLNDINLHVRKTEAVKTKNMISGVSSSLQGVSDVVGILIAAIWVLALVIMIIVFAMSANERRKEFAILRVVGASRKKLSRVVMTEGILVSVTGSIIGVVIACIAIVPFSTFIETTLNLPFLLPSVPLIIVVAVISLVAATVAGSLTSLVASRKISKMDTGLILRESN